MTETKKQSAKSTYANIFKREEDGWKPLGNGGWAELHLCYNYENENFRLLAWKLDTEFVILNTQLTKSCTYKISSRPNFYIFRDEKSTYALGFHEDSLSQASEFAIAVSHVITKVLTNKSEKKKLLSHQSLDVFTLTSHNKEQDEKSDSTTRTRHGYIDSETGRFRTYDIYWTREIVDGYKFMEILYIEGSFPNMQTKQFGVAPELLPSKKFPGYSSELPTLLLDLKDMIKSLGGYKSVGIFRLAPEGKRNDEVKKLINRGGGEWKSNCNDVNLCANLLKVWLRELPEPIMDQVDRELIERSQELGAVAKAVEKFPEPGRSILLWLWDMCTEIAEFEKENKMSPENLSIVIAPNLFDAKQFTNPMTAMTYSATASTFFQKGIEWRQVSDVVQIL